MITMPHYDVDVTIRLTVQSQPDVEPNTIANLLADIISDGPSEEYWVSHVEDMSINNLTKY